MTKNAINSERKNYSERDLETSLREDFVNERADFLFIDGWNIRNNFVEDKINYGIKKGYLKFNRVGGDEQYTRWEYILTKEGKIHFGII